MDSKHRKDHITERADRFVQKFIDKHKEGMANIEKKRAAERPSAPLPTDVRRAMRSAMLMDSMMKIRKITGSK